MSNFTREQYIEQYTQIYKDAGKLGTGATDDMRNDEYYSIPERGGFKKGMSLLDYGCGYGAILNRYDVDDYYGVDIIPKVIELARETFPNKKFDVLEIGKLQCEPKDFCIALSVFTHVLLQDVDECLGDIARNTKKFFLVDILEGHDAQSDLHIRYWNKEEFVKKLKEFGFEVFDEFNIVAPGGYNHTYLATKKIK